MLIFISGGVRSGKSTFAEQLASELVSGADALHYIATSECYDHEMAERIKKHQLDRAQSRKSWQTWEQPVNIEDIVNHFTLKDIVLIDCLTTWLGNELFNGNCWQDEKFVIRLFDRVKSTFEAYQSATKATIIVSNEIFNSGVPHDKGSFVYMRLLGKLHQYLTNIADQVYLVEVGIPQLMKEGANK